MGIISDMSNNIQSDWSQLQREWQMTSDLWNDEAKNRFEREYWMEFGQTIPLVLKVMDQLSIEIMNARQRVK